ncbi:unnamed protein product [Musa acuminata subsp. malaccensis]|uniref:(wild Malaysian banana) hypothetical protein n=1 Tax=Musa acuminata subsp. malaccensis TaxID=214687 RepID=A0A804I5U0_MUSAM|nr:unnamed protein product [Musa acuminata subsp. malaccensis]
MIYSQGTLLHQKVYKSSQMLILQTEHIKTKAMEAQTKTKLLLAYSRSLFEKIEILEATAMWLKQIYIPR